MNLKEIKENSSQATRIKVLQSIAKKFSNQDYSGWDFSGWDNQVQGGIYSASRVKKEGGFEIIRYYSNALALSETKNHMACDVEVWEATRWTYGPDGEREEMLERYVAYDIA